MPLRALLLLLFLAATLHAQLAPPTNSPIIGARQPALSPDGKQLAFVYRGDIWTSDASGGRAIPITSHLEMDAYPIYSPEWMKHFRSGADVMNRPRPRTMLAIHIGYRAGINGTRTMPALRGMADGEVKALWEWLEAVAKTSGQPPR